MATVPKLIKAAFDFSKARHEDLLVQGHTVLAGLTGNEHFPNPPVDLNVLKAALDAYSAAIVEAQDRGRKAIAARNQQGESLIRILRSLAAYVEHNCKDDMNVFLTSGLRPRSTARTPAQPLEPPKILGLDQGASGQFLVWIKAVFKAKHYELRFGSVRAAGETPVSWLTKVVPNARTAASLDGLTPGTIYAIQVRAYGTLGYTDWSDYAARMSI